MQFFEDINNGNVRVDLDIPIESKAKSRGVRDNSKKRIEWFNSLPIGASFECTHKEYSILATFITFNMKRRGLPTKGVLAIRTVSGTGPDRKVRVWKTTNTEL